MIATLSTLFGGIGLFLLGMILMTDGLKAIAGDALRSLLANFTGSRIKAVATGAGITALVQYSSATTLATIGFVSAGLLSFSNAIGVIIGANLGTTSTGWIVSLLGLKFSIGKILLPLIGVGALMRLLGRDRLAHTGTALAGLGVIFVGIDVMQGGMGDLAAQVDLSQYSAPGMQARLILVMVGAVMTMLMQSSSAAVATTLTALSSSTISTIFRHVLVLVLCVSLAACSAEDELSASLSDYRERLARVLQIDIPVVQRPAVIPFPSQRTLTLALEEPSLDLLDFLSLLDCELNILVAGRNSGLGKVLTPSQRWIYEHEFQRLGQGCVTLLEKEGPLALELAAVVELKKRQMPRVAWNALWAGPEYQVLMAVRTPSADTDFRLTDGVELAAALSALLQWSRELTVAQVDTLSVERSDPASGRATELSANLEDAYRTLIGSPSAGEVMYAIEYSITALQSINQAINERLAKRPLCHLRRPTEQARILNNVLIHSYAGRVQPQLAALQRLYQRWVPVLRQQVFELSAQDAAIGALAAKELHAYSLRYLQQGQGSVWYDYQQVLQAHASVWTTLLTDCSLRVGGSYDPLHNNTR